MDSRIFGFSACTREHWVMCGCCGSSKTFLGSFFLAVSSPLPVAYGRGGPCWWLSEGSSRLFAKFNLALSPQSLPEALSPSVAPDLRWLGCFISNTAGRMFWYNVTVLVKMDFKELIRVDSHLLNHSRLLHSMVRTKINPSLVVPMILLLRGHSLLPLCSARLVFLALFLIISVFLIPECQLHP